MTLHAFSWVIDGKLAGMAMPDGLPEDWRELRKRGIGAVVNLTLRCWPDGQMREAGLAYLWLPVQEFQPPSPDQVDAFLKFCREQISRDCAVVVHCLAGRGRTGTMAACYMVERGMAPHEAIRSVRRLRPGSIETEGQEHAIYAFAARLKEGPGP